MRWIMLIIGIVLFIGLLYVSSCEFAITPEHTGGIGWR